MEKRTQYGRLREFYLGLGNTTKTTFKAWLDGRAAFCFDQTGRFRQFRCRLMTVSLASE